MSSESRSRPLAAGAGAILASLACGVNATVSSDDAIVVGTIVTETRSLAIVELEPGMQRIMSVDDKLNNCTISVISRDHIIIECAAGASRMLLDRAKRLSGRRAAMDAPNRDVHLFSLPRVWFDGLLSDRQRLVNAISLEPAVVGGYVYGYRVTALKPDGGLSQFGIEPGDVITHVNNAPASYPETFMQTIDALAGQPAFNLQLERHGVRLEFNYVLVEA